jgi:hypothetical protein
MNSRGGSLSAEHCFARKNPPTMTASIAGPARLARFSLIQLSAGGERRDSG